MAARAQLAPDQLAKERSIRFAIFADCTMLVSFTLIGIIGGSLTLVAESIRGFLIITTEAFSFLVMRRVHRDSLLDLDFGTGKIEQIANLVISAGMVFGATWVFWGVFGILAGDKQIGSPLGLTVAAMIAAVNTYINVVAWDGMRRAARAGKSIIMQAQLRSRFVRVFSSLFVQTTMTIAAVSSDATIAIWAEAIGSAFVACFIVSNAFDMARAGLPDLLDRSVEEEVQLVINRALASHFDDYALLHRVRTRRSGSSVFVELVLAYDGAMPMAEVARRTAAMKQTLHTDIDGADITIEATSSDA